MSSSSDDTIEIRGRKVTGEELARLPVGGTYVDQQGASWRKVQGDHPGEILLEPITHARRARLATHLKLAALVMFGFTVGYAVSAWIGGRLGW